MFQSIEKEIEGGGEKPWKSWLAVKSYKIITDREKGLANPVFESVCNVLTDH